MENYFDIVLANGKSVAIIETKNRIHKVYLGIAGFSFNQAVTKQAKKYDVGIIRQVGKSVEMETEHLKAY